MARPGLADGFVLPREVGAECTTSMPNIAMQCTSVRLSATTASPPIIQVTQWVIESGSRASSISMS